MTKDKNIDHDRAELGALLQKALMLELSTIPPYATACYSIKEQGQYDRSSPEIVNAEPIEVIRQVMVEEMLHMVLVANLMNAINCKPVVNDPKQLPSYPMRILDGKGPELRLRRFMPDQIKCFREVERAPKDPANDAHRDYETIGGFYLYVLSMLEKACAAHGERKIFIGDTARQIDSGDYYGAGGDVIAVHDLATARTAIREIMDEGEGAALGHSACDNDLIPAPKGEEHWDIAHFFKFDEILHSRYYLPTDRLGEPPSGSDLVVDWTAVWPMKDDPKAADYASTPEIRELSDRFNRSYSELLDGLNAAFNGDKPALSLIVPVMFSLKDQAQHLMRVPLPDTGYGTTAGPLWRYVPTTES